MKQIDRIPEIGEFIYYQENDKTFTLCEVVPNPDNNGVKLEKNSNDLICLKHPKDHPNVFLGIFANHRIHGYDPRLFFQ